MHPSSVRQKKRIGFVELPDHAADLLIRMSQKPGWQVAVVVCKNASSEVVRVAESLGIPVLDAPHRTALVSCDRVVVGNQSLFILVSVKELLRASAVEVLRLSQFAELLEKEEKAQRVVPEAFEAAAPKPHEEALAADLPAAVVPLPEWMQPAPFAPALRPLSAGTPPQETPETRGQTPASYVHSPRPPAPPERVPAPTAPPRVPAPPPARSPEPKTTPQSAGAGRAAGAPPRLFHAATLLGGKLAGVTALPLDTGDPALLDILDRAREVTLAKTSSIMLVDAGGEHLRIAAARGLPSEMVDRVCQLIGEGVTGTVFASHNPMTERGQFPSLAEEDGRPVFRVAASVPIMIGGKPIGVLSINAESAEDTLLDKKFLNPLGRLAKRLPGLILSALDLGALAPEVRGEALRLQIDRLMVLDRSLPDRLGVVGEAVRRAMQAETAHFLLIDSLRRRFQSVSAPLGMALLADRAQSIDQGIFGWVMRHEKPCAFELADEQTGERVATVICPLGSGRGRSLFVLENIPLIGMTKDDALDAVLRTTTQVEGIVDIEEGVAVQELLTELKMRINDETEHIERLPIERRLRSFLDLALGIVAAESAIWVPAGGGMPVATQPESLDAARVLAQAWEQLESLITWVQEKGTQAEGAVATEFDPQAPHLPAPYVGVPGPDGESVLIVLFSPDQKAMGNGQLPNHVLWQVLTRMCELIPRRDAAKGQGESVASARAFAQSWLAAHGQLGGPGGGGPPAL